MGLRTGESAWLWLCHWWQDTTCFFPWPEIDTGRCAGDTSGGPVQVHRGTDVEALCTGARETPCLDPCVGRLFSNKFFSYQGEREDMPWKINIERFSLMPIKMKTIRWLMKSNSSQKWQELWNLDIQQIIKDLRTLSLEFAYSICLLMWIIQGGREKSPTQIFRGLPVSAFGDLDNIYSLWALTITSIMLD